MKAVYTLRPTTREERGCWCPYPPGCSDSPCKAGPRWKIWALVRHRHSWATASPITIITEDRRAAELQRLDAELTATRRELRLKREAKRVVRHFHRYSSDTRARHAASHRLGHRQRQAVGEHFYTHPQRPGVAFSSRSAAARAVVDAKPEQSQASDDDYQECQNCGDRVYTLSSRFWCDGCEAEADSANEAADADPWGDTLDRLLTP